MPLPLLLLPPAGVQHDPIHAPSWNACQGSPLHSFIAAASCNGQGTEASFPYDAVDDLTCNASPEAIAERSAVQNLSWAFVPSYPNSNADLMRAVTYAPTLIGLRASGKAWQYYRTGVMPCSADADVTINTREHNICSCTNLAQQACCCCPSKSCLQACQLIGTTQSSVLLCCVLQMLRRQQVWSCTARSHGCMQASQPVS